MIQNADSMFLNLHAVIAVLLLLSALLSYPISFGLIRLYRRAVLKSMNRRASGREIEPSITEAGPLTAAAPAEPEFTVFDGDSLIPEKKESETGNYRMQIGRWGAAAIYAFSGTMFSLTLTVLYLIASGIEISLIRMLTLGLVFAYPIVLTIILVAAADRRLQAIIFAIYILLFSVLIGVSAVLQENPVLIPFVTLWIILNLPSSLLLLTFLTRRVRAVGPLVSSFLFFAILGSQIVVSLAVIDDRVLRGIVVFASYLGLGGAAVLIGLIVLGFLALIPIGWVFLRLVGMQYERKKINDQSISLDAVWLMFGIVNSLFMASNGLVWIGAGFMAFVVYKLTARIGFAVFARRMNSNKAAKTLLVLRVFSLGKRSERLFRALEMHWRYLGSVRLIAGPDLATSVLEPHEFLDFVSGKLSRRFIDGEQTLDKRFLEMDNLPDRDGRFRVNDFFCFQDTWKMVLARLVRDSDAVLMDLRGFSSRNEGCIHEIEQLINVAPIKKVIFLIDDQTDIQFLFQKIGQLWLQMAPHSPNRVPSGSQIKMFRFIDSGANELRQLCRQLCVAAENQ